MRAIDSFLLHGMLFSGMAFVISCASPTITYVPMPVPALPALPAPTPTAASTPPAERENLAVLPIEDDKLFRSERALLRLELTGHLARLLPDRIIMPLAEVDTKIRAVSQTTGHRCAFEGVPIERRARYKGFQTTHIMHVSGLPKEGMNEQLWVEIIDGSTTLTTFQGPWNSKLPRVDAYRGAFAAFIKNDSAGALGGLAASGSYDDAARQGPVTICETKFFGACDKSSIDWQDRISSLASCFSGTDEVTRDLLVQGDGGIHCEMENLDDPGGTDVKLEACLCTNLGTSIAMTKRSGRRTIRVHYEAPDLHDKPRPELRTVETTTNIDSQDDWHSMTTIVNGKKEYHSIRRLTVENLDGLAAPLARCAVPAKTVILADIDVREDGTPTSGHVVSSGLDKPIQECIEQALTRGAFDCTDDGKNARIRVAMEW